MFAGLLGWHFLILLGVLVVPVVVVLLIVRALRRRDPDTNPVVSFTLWLAAVWAGLAVIGAVVTLLSTLMSPAVTMTVPVQEYWPSFPGVTLESSSATRVGGGFTTAELSIEGLSTGTRVLWAIGSTTGALLPGAVAALIALMCFQLLRGAAFAPVLAQGAMVTAVVVMVGGLATQILCGIAGSMASQQALSFTGASYTGYPDDFDLWNALPQPTFAMQMDFWPIGAGLALAALSAVFRYGARLQRDTELLV